MFPFSHNGAVSWGEGAGEMPRAFAETFLVAAADELKRAGAKEVFIGERRVSFKKPLFYYAVTDWILAPTDKGFIEIAPRPGGALVTYHLSFLRMLLLVSAVVFGVIGLFILSAQKMPLTAKVVVLAVAWLWLFGTQYLITRLRFPRFVRRILSEVEAR